MMLAPVGAGGSCLAGGSAAIASSSRGLVIGCSGGKGESATTALQWDGLRASSATTARRAVKVKGPKERFDSKMALQY